MTRPAKGLWPSVAFGLMLSGTALAQTQPSDQNNNTNPPTTSTPSNNDNTTAPTTTTNTSDTTNTTNTTNTTPTTDQTTSQPSAQGTVNVQPPPQPPPAQPTIVETPPPQPTTYVVPPTTVIREKEGDHLLSGIGIALAAGGGAGGFTDSTLRNQTNVGGDWDVRATIGSRSLVALEGSYIGSAQAINALGLSNNAMLVGNGVQGAVRLNATFDFPVQPFIYAGAAWRHYNITNTNQNLSDIKNKDDVLEVPMGLGIAGHLSGLILDVRGEYRATSQENLVPETTSTGTITTAPMNRWDAKATLGVEF